MTTSPETFLWKCLPLVVRVQEGGLSGPPGERAQRVERQGRLGGWRLDADLQWAAVCEPSGLASARLYSAVMAATTLKRGGLTALKSPQ